MRTECPVASGEDVSGQRLPWRVAGSPKQQHSVWKRDTQAASEADWVWPCKAQSIMLERFMRTAKHSRCPSSDGLGGQKISAPERSRLIRPQQDATFGKGSVKAQRGGTRMRFSNIEDVQSRQERVDVAEAADHTISRRHENKGGGNS